jgi:hypothetical protein
LTSLSVLKGPLEKKFTDDFEGIGAAELRAIDPRDWREW